jgi:hypothetical protein
MTNVEGAKIASESDERTVNNVMRHEYRVLTEPEKIVMKQIKDLGLTFLRTIDLGVPKGCEASLAKTKVQEAVMWAIKGLTS